MEHTPNAISDQALCPSDPHPADRQILLDGRSLGLVAEFDTHLGAVDVAAIEGRINLRECRHLGVKATGFTTHAPTFAFDLVNMHLEEGQSLDLTFETRGDCDTTLLVSGPNGHWAFADDAEGFEDAALVLTGDQAVDGTYKVWMGTYDPEVCHGELLVQTSAVFRPEHVLEVDRGDVDILEQSVTELAVLLDRLGGFVDDLAPVAEALGSMIPVLDTRLDRFAMILASLGEQQHLIASATQALEELIGNDFAAALVALQEIRASMAAFSADQHDLNASYGRLNEEHLHLNAELTDLMARLEEAVVRNDLEQLLLKMQEYLASLASAGDDYTALNTAHQRLNEAQAALGAEHNDLTQVYHTLNRDYADLSQQHSRLNARHDALNAEHQVLTEAHRELNAAYSVLTTAQGAHNEDHGQHNRRFEELLALMEHALPKPHVGCVTAPEGPAALATTGAHLRNQIWIYAQTKQGQQVRLSDCAQLLPEGTDLGGYVNVDPNLSLDLIHISGHSLRVHAHSDSQACDPVLLIRDGDGTLHYDDDQGDGTNALVRIDDARDGTFHFWVGSHSSNACTMGLDIQSTRIRP